MSIVTALITMLSVSASAGGRLFGHEEQPAASTRSLFTYRRDDTAPERATTIRIRASHTASQPIQQDVFGNFAEHLGGVIYQGVWAQALLNPNLERIDTGDSAPQAWGLTNAAWQEGGYESPRCVRLSGAESTLSQRIFLPGHRTLGYRVSLHLRAPESPGAVTIRLVPATGPGEASRSAEAHSSEKAESATWQRHTLHWRLQPGIWQKGELLRFEIRHESGGAVDVDQIELFPDDAVDGMDPDVIRKARDWHIPVLRWPGGNFASGYHWKDGVGPRDRRPTRRNNAWGGIEPNHFGTDEFLDFARHVGAVPQFTVNAGDGTPEEAAEWVRYCNARSLRVPIWEIGNELYGGWQIGHTDPAGNASRFVRFRDAMLKADPRIKIIATGQGDEFLPAGLEHDREWNQALLRAAVANGGRAPDYLSLHPLVPLPGDLRGLPYSDQFESAMAQPEFVDRTLLPSVMQWIQEVEGPSAPTRVAPTEWGIILGGDQWLSGPNHDVEAGAIFNALTLNAMLRHSDYVTLANMTALMHGGGIKKPNGVVIADPQYYTQQLYAAAAPALPVETEWSGPGRDVPRRGFLPEVADVSNVDIFSALSQDRSRLLLFAINRTLTESCPIRIHLDDFAAGHADGTILTSPDPQARNTWQLPDTVAPRSFQITTPQNGGPWTATLPPHSLLVITFRTGTPENQTH